MPWENQVAGGFGIVDCIFAGHPLDRERAQKAIADAKKAGASFSDFEKEMVWHIYKNFKAPDLLQEHIEKQVSAAKKLW